MSRVHIHDTVHVLVVEPQAKQIYYAKGQNFSRGRLFRTMPLLHMLNCKLHMRQKQMGEHFQMVLCAYIIIVCTICISRCTPWGNWIYSSGQLQPDSANTCHLQRYII